MVKMICNLTQTVIWAEPEQAKAYEASGFARRAPKPAPKPRKRKKDENGVRDGQ